MTPSPGPAAPSSQRRARRRRSSHLLQLGSAEQPRRAQDQHENKDHKDRDVLVLDREIARPEGFDQPDQNAAQNRSRQRADAPQNRSGKRLYPGKKPDEEVDDAVRS